ncbi:hypothetical protein CPB84DRAFT_1761674 [Gymnopilus junonius]|uniref:RING-type E3 ubiquitin transferase n=1 Tax=Gymnopilus junonius TaxID=109634 RepID=A0A9P5TT00_GYMJU|nr:hypothetical protein CPB84DRAFT_1761674 [Gymnopilus junonius]
MSAQVATQTHTASTEPSRGGRRNNKRSGNATNRGSNRSTRPSANKKGQEVQEAEQKSQGSVESAKQNEEQAIVEKLDAVTISEAGSDMDICWICAEPVKYYSLSECNHRTCHVCAIRLRALYKKTECTFCKEPQKQVIFTTSPDTPFSSYTPEMVPFKDPKLSVSFETEEMMEETLILLRFNCADSECDYIGNGWGDLRLHARAVHGKLMCDLCIRHKKVFSHEHTLYTPSALAAHLPSMNQRYGKAALKEIPEGGVHPLCQFCRECFFGDDELYAHMRERHEECFICKGTNFQNYESLERHFNTAHHPCNNSECLARKFVVFNTALDLKAHMQQASTSTPAAAARPVPGGGNRRRENFGGALTTDAGPTLAQAVNNDYRSRPASPQPATDLDPAVAERHANFLARLQSLAPNPVAAVTAVKAATRSYRFSESSAKDLILTIWNVMDQNLEHTASIVNAFIDLLDEEEKKQDLLSSWKGFNIEQRRQFPDLTPTSIGSGYAGITSGRVLNAKHATAARSSQSQQVWNRVAQAANNSSDGPSSAPSRPQIVRAQMAEDRFPALGGGSRPSSGPAPSVSQPLAPSYRQPQRATPWSASSIQPSGMRSQPAPTASRSSTPKQAAPPKLSNALFPELPTSSTSRSRPQVRGNVSLKNILGTSAVPAAHAWGTGPAGGSPAESAREGGAAATSEEVTNAAAGGKGKKQKGKQKQTLFTLGSFPT